MKKFSNFIETKKRKIKKELKLIKKALEHEKYEVKEFLNEYDPYIYLKIPERDSLFFEGIRIYKIGESFAYRVQNSEKSHPYGKSYKLDVEGIFNDFVSENADEKKAGLNTIKELGKQIKQFIKK